MQQKDQKKKTSPVKVILALVFLFLTDPFLLLPVLFFGGIGFGIYYLVTHSQKNAPPKQTNSARQSRREVFDDCPQPLFCFHRDKGEHHVRRGREIDPWDRPDIDISKYQRR